MFLEYQLAKSTSVSIVNCNGRDYLVQADGKWQLLKNKGQPGIVSDPHYNHIIYYHKMLYSAVIPPPPQPLLCIMPQSPVTAVITIIIDSILNRSSHQIPTILNYICLIIKTFIQFPLSNLARINTGLLLIVINVGVA